MNKQEIINKLHELGKGLEAESGEPLPFPLDTTEVNFADYPLRTLNHLSEGLYNSAMKFINEMEMDETLLDDFAINFLDSPHMSYEILCSRVYLNFLKLLYKEMSKLSKFKGVVDERYTKYEQTLDGGKKIVKCNYNSEVNILMSKLSYSRTVLMSKKPDLSFDISIF